MGLSKKSINVSKTVLGLGQIPNLSAAELALILGGGKVIEVTYKDLKYYRDNGLLSPSQLYRLTDYECTTSQEDTRSAGHQFDIIIQATSRNTLDENVRFALHKGDTYFAKCNLSAWHGKYCLDNDRKRFNWAVEENEGLGVAGIQICCTLGVTSSSNVGSYAAAIRYPEGDEEGKYAWKVISTGHRYSTKLNNINQTYFKYLEVQNILVYTSSPTPEIFDQVDANTLWSGHATTVSEYSPNAGYSEDSGKGVIYWLEDENFSKFSYDFKNIQVKRYKIVSQEGSHSNTVNYVGRYLGYRGLKYVEIWQSQENKRGINVDSAYIIDVNDFIWLYSNSITIGVFQSLGDANLLIDASLQTEIDTPYVLERLIEQNPESSESYQELLDAYEQGISSGSIIPVHSDSNCVGNSVNSIDGLTDLESDVQFGNIYSRYIPNVVIYGVAMWMMWPIGSIDGRDILADLLIIRRPTENIVGTGSMFINLGTTRNKVSDGCSNITNVESSSSKFDDYCSNIYVAPGESVNTVSKNSSKVFINGSHNKLEGSDLDISGDYGDIKTKGAVISGNCNVIVNLDLSYGSNSITISGDRNKLELGHIYNTPINIDGDDNYVYYPELHSDWHDSLNKGIRITGDNNYIHNCDLVTISGSNCYIFDEDRVTITGTVKKSTSGELNINGGFKKVQYEVQSPTYLINIGSDSNVVIGPKSTDIVINPEGGWAAHDVVIGSNCRGIKLYGSEDNVKFGDFSYWVTAYANLHDFTVGRISTLTIGESSKTAYLDKVSIESGSNITLKGHVTKASIGNNCSNINIWADSNKSLDKISVGDNCDNIEVGYNGENIKVGDNCSNIKTYNDSNIEYESNCKYISLVDNYSTPIDASGLSGITFKSNSRRIKLKFTPSGADKSQRENIIIHSGISDLEASNDTEIIVKPETDTLLEIAKNSSGQIVQYCTADLVPTT